MAGYLKREGKTHSLWCNPPRLLGVYPQLSVDSSAPPPASLRDRRCDLSAPECLSQRLCRSPQWFLAPLHFLKSSFLLEGMRHPDIICRHGEDKNKPQQAYKTKFSKSPSSHRVNIINAPGDRQNHPFHCSRVYPKRVSSEEAEAAATMAEPIRSWTRPACHFKEAPVAIFRPNAS